MAKILCLLLIVLINQIIAISNNKDEPDSNGAEARRNYGNNQKPFRFEGESNNAKYPMTYDKYRVQDRHKHRDRNKVDRDSEALSSGQFDNGYYGPPEETDTYQGFTHGTTYVSTVPFGATHTDKDADIPNGYQRPSYGLEHQPHGGGQFQGHSIHQHQHYGPDPHTLALKSLFFPLAGVALLGAAAALATNPVLLQLGVISGKKRRRRSIPEIAYDRANNVTSPYKYHIRMMNNP